MHWLHGRESLRHNIVCDQSLATNTGFAHNAFAILRRGKTHCTTKTRLGPQKKQLLLHDMYTILQPTCCHLLHVPPQAKIFSCMVTSPIFFLWAMSHTPSFTRKEGIDIIGSWVKALLCLYVVVFCNIPRMPGCPHTLIYYERN